MMQAIANCVALFNFTIFIDPTTLVCIEPAATDVLPVLHRTVVLLYAKLAVKIAILSNAIRTSNELLLFTQVFSKVLKMICL